MRACLKEQEQTLPNQIKKEIQNPTLRWVFQLLHGIHSVKIYTKKKVYEVIEGITDLRQKILQLFGDSVAGIYQISYG